MAQLQGCPHGLHSSSVEAQVSRDLHSSLLIALEAGVQKAFHHFAEDAQHGRMRHVAEGAAHKFAASASWDCSCHIGFYTNSQVIANLMHLIVQLALFPRAQTSDAELQVNSRSAHVADQFVEASLETAEAGIQVEPRQNVNTQRVASPSHSPSRSVGVRIGGGYHIVAAEEASEEAGRSLSPNRRSNDQHAYALGAISKRTPLSRYSIGTYAKGTMFGERAVAGSPSKSASTQYRSDIQYGLYRVLKPGGSRGWGQEAEREENDYEELLKRWEPVYSAHTPTHPTSLRRPHSARSSRGVAGANLQEAAAAHPTSLRPHSARSSRASAGANLQEAAAARPDAAKPEAAWEAASPVESSPGSVSRVFQSYCDQNNMDGKTFAKFCKDANLIDRHFTSADVDLAFAMIVPKGQRRIGLPQFSTLLGMIAEKKGISKDNVHQATAFVAPTYSGTSPHVVRFHDDKSTYTGSHRQREPPPMPSHVRFLDRPVRPCTAQPSQQPPGPPPPPPAASQEVHSVIEEPPAHKSQDISELSRKIMARLSSPPRADAGCGT